MKTPAPATVLRFLTVLLGLACWGGSGTRAVAQASDVFYEEAFDDGAVASRWTGHVVLDTHDAGSCLKFSNAAPANLYALTTISSATVPAAALAGRRIIKAQVKASALSTKIHSYDGINLVLIYHLANGTASYGPSSQLDAGTYDWKEICFPVVVPAAVGGSAVASVSLQAGLQGVSGTAWIDEIHLEADPALVSETFEDGQAAISTRWTLGGAGFTTVTGYNNAGQAMSMANANAASSVSRGLPLSAAAFAGRRVVVSGMVKGAAISAPPNPGNGVQLVLAYTTSDGTAHSSQAVIPSGTFGWTDVYVVANLPQDATSLSLSAGLELVSGTAVFDNLRVDADPMLWSETFDDGNVAGRWHGSYAVIPRGAGSAMQITSTSTNAAVRVTQTLPVELVRGRHLLLRGSASGSGVTAPPAGYLGIKAMLSWVTNGVSQNTRLAFNSVEPPTGSGTFGWTEETAILDLPDSITAATLTVGLEDVSGVVAFDDLSLSLLDSSSPYWANPTPNFKGHSAPVLRGVMVSTALSATNDVPTLVSWHPNVLRWQLGQNAYPDGLDTPDYADVLNAELAKFDAIAASPQFAGNGIVATLDLHSLSRDAFDSRANQDLLIQSWRTLAARYASSGVVWAYDLANEPDDSVWTPEVLTWNELASLVAQNIRCIDPNKAVVVESLKGTAPNFAILRPAPVHNAVYSAHIYDPWDYASQQIPGYTTNTWTYPGTIDGKSWDAAQVQANLQPIVDFQDAYQTSIYVGEFSAVRWAPSATAPGPITYLTDCIDAFETNGWDWSYHAFRESPYWDVEISASTAHTSSARSPTPTDRQTLLMNWFLENSPSTPANQ